MCSCDSGVVIGVAIGHVEEMFACNSDKFFVNLDDGGRFDALMLEDLTEASSVASTYNGNFSGVLMSEKVFI